MRRLGYDRYVAQGGDWGNAVTEQMALLTPAGLIGIHTNMPATVPDSIQAALTNGDARPRTSRPRSGARGISSRSSTRTGWRTRRRWRNRPQTLYSIADSPVGLAAWMLDHDARSYDLIARVFAGASEGLTPDDVLDNVTLYWLTNTAVSSARLYWESKLAVLRAEGRDAPDRGQRLPRRDLRGTAQLGDAGVPEPHPLQPARPRRALRGVGAARAVLAGDARRLPVAAVTVGLGQVEQVDAGELNIGFADVGPADGPAVLLLHGWPYDINSYAEVAPMLADAGHRVIVPHLRGYGTTAFRSATASATASSRCSHSTRSR